jgi:hypothetical protein
LPFRCHAASTTEMAGGRLCPREGTALAPHSAHHSQHRAPMRTATPPARHHLYGWFTTSPHDL